MKTPHKHAALIKQFAEDMAIDEKLVSKWQFKLGSDWETLISPPQWYEDYEYRREPNTITVNGVEVPEPIRTIKEGEKYWSLIIVTSSPEGEQWEDLQCEKLLLKKGLLHSTKEAAQAHIDALLLPSKKK